MAGRIYTDWIIDREPLPDSLPSVPGEGRGREVEAELEMI